MDASRRNRSHFVWSLVRLCLCAAALLYVISRAELADTVWLAGQDAPVRLVAWREKAAEVRMDGQIRTVAEDRLQRSEDGAIRCQPGLRSLWRRCDKWLLLPALGLLGLHLSLMAVRFRWILHLQGIPLGWARTIAVCWLGSFYNFVIPGMTGGDVVRAASLMRAGWPAHSTVAALGLDRVTGLTGLFLLAALVGLVAPGQLPIVRQAAFGSLLLLVLVVVALLVVAHPRVARALSRLPMGRHLERLCTALQVSRSHWPAMLGAVAMTVLLQAVAMTSHSFAAVALGMAPAWRHYFVCLPIALVIAAVPIVPMGLGTLEAAMTLLLVPATGSVSQVLGLALLMRIMALLWALPGGLVPVLLPAMRQAKQPARQSCQLATQVVD